MREQQVSNLAVAVSTLNAHTHAHTQEQTNLAVAPPTLNAHTQEHASSPTHPKQSGGTPDTGVDDS